MEMKEQKIEDFNEALAPAMQEESAPEIEDGEEDSEEEEKDLSGEADEDEACEGELSLKHPHLANFYNGLESAIRAAVVQIKDCETITVSAKIVFEKPEEAPEFSNEAKIIAPADFSVSVQVKKEICKTSGMIHSFGARMINGHVEIFDPDRQIGLDDIIHQAEKEVGNEAPKKDPMADAPIDLQSRLIAPGYGLVGPENTL